MEMYFLFLLFCVLQIGQIIAVNPGSCPSDFINICFKAKPEAVCQSDTNCKITEKCCQTACVAKLCADAVFADQGVSNNTSPNTNKTKVYKPVHNKEEQTAKKGKSYTIDCTIAPDEKDVDITWKVSDNIIKGPNEKYSFNAANSPKRKSLVINEVEYSDRKEFVCISSYMNVTSTLKVRLRVRDPLGAVWPLIGILVGSCLLFLIIFICRATEKGKTTDGKEESEEKVNLVET